MGDFSAVPSAPICRAGETRREQSRRPAFALLVVKIPGAEARWVDAADGVRLHRSMNMDVIACPDCREAVPGGTYFFAVVTGISPS